MNPNNHQQIQQIIDFVKSNARAISKEELIAKLEYGWEILPDTKTDYEDSYWIINYLTHLNLQNGNPNAALKWAKIFPQCDPERLDDGMREFLLAKVAFEANEHELAKENFKLADEKSEGRCWEKAEPKYFKYFKSK